MRKSLMLIDCRAPTIEHILAIQNVKLNVEHLCVGMFMNPVKTIKPGSSNFEQYMWLSSNGQIDEIVPYCTEIDLHDIMNFYPMKELWVGKHFSTNSFTGKDICQNRGVDIKYFDQHLTFNYYTPHS